MERISKRRGNGISGFCGWNWRINEKGRFRGLIDTTTGRLVEKSKIGKQKKSSVAIKKKIAIFLFSLNYTRATAK